MATNNSKPAAPLSKPEISDALRARVAEISNENAKYRLSVTARKSVSDRRSNITAKTASDIEPSKHVNSAPILPSAKPFKRMSRRPLPPAIAGKVLMKPTSPLLHNLPHVSHNVPTQSANSKSPAVDSAPAKESKTVTKSKDIVDDEIESEIVFDTLPDEASTIKVVKDKKDGSRKNSKDKEKNMSEDDTIPREAVKEFNERRAQHEEAKARLMGKIAQVTSEFSIERSPKSQFAPTPKKYKGPPLTGLNNKEEDSKVPQGERGKQLKDSGTESNDTKNDIDLKRKVVLLEATLSSTEERFQDSKKLHEQEIKDLKEFYEKQLKDQTASNDETDRLQNELAKSRQKISQMEKANEDQTSLIEELEQEISKLQASTVPSDHYEHIKNELENQVNELKASNDGILKEHSQLKFKLAEIDIINDEKKALEANLKDVMEELDRCKTEVGELEAELKTEMEENKRLKQKITDYEISFNEANEEIERLQNEAMAAKEKASLVDQLLASKEKLEAEIKDLKDKHSHMEAEINEHKQDKIELKRDLDMALTNNSTDNESKDSEEQFKNLIKEKENVIKNLQSELGDLRETFDLAKQESSRNIDDLLRIYEAVQQENDDLRDRLHQFSSKSPILNQENDPDNLVKEKEELEQAAKYWEENAHEFEQELNKVEEERMILERELEALRSQERTGMEGEVRYISNDAELLEFIETMTNKTESFKAELEQLKAENASLQEECQKLRDSPLDSAFVSRPDTSPSNVLVSSDNHDQLQEDYNYVMEEFNKVSIDLHSVEREKKRLEKELVDSKDEMEKIRRILDEERAKNLGNIKEKADESSSLAAMRDDFRKAVDEVRKECNETLKKEINERFEAEKTIRALKRQNNSSMYTKVNRAIQTVNE